MTHGTRGAYQVYKCRCLPCRAANAAYLAQYRDKKRKGLPLLGKLISAVDAQRQIRLLKGEWYKRWQIAKALGLHHSLARLHHQQSIRLRTALKVRRFYQIAILDGLPSVDRASENPQSLQND